MVVNDQSFILADHGDDHGIAIRTTSACLSSRIKVLTSSVSYYYQRMLPATELY